ncbi:phosphopantetheine-binding protein [Actinomadura xylanilytica]|uniref:phosphopantetheine-binding protein n=1 Tax=Actinomadura xylanilytica TaxID=887459 RepID=UPI00255B2F40|nr:phosphopantetheine-binding protein [Actinomadura xylanilytica]MDL4775348.1 phosphopantetheine-binding protein [Actinomadura xylanilytica]
MSDSMAPAARAHPLATLLGAHPEVLDAAVLAPGALEDGEVAVVVPDGYASGPELAGHVAAVLGLDAVPPTIVLLPRIPRAADGTVHVGELRAKLESWPSVYRFALPRTAAERRLAEVWCRVLERPWIGVHDDFIEAGGDSRAAAVIMAELAGEAGPAVSLADLFELATIAELAARIAADDD